MDRIPLPVWSLPDLTAARKNAESALGSDNDSLRIAIQAVEGGERLYKVTVSAIVGGKEREARSGLLTENALIGQDVHAKEKPGVPAVFITERSPLGALGGKKKLALQPLLKGLAANPDLRLDAQITLKGMKELGRLGLQASAANTAGAAEQAERKKDAIYSRNARLSLYNRSTGKETPLDLDKLGRQPARREEGKEGTCRIGS